MPITPLHIGIPGLVAAGLKDKMNLSAAIIGSVIIDLDFFLYLSIRTPIHGNLHTFLGATILSIILIPLIFVGRRRMKKIENWFKLDSSFKLYPIAIGAFLGTFSHILLDSIIYRDMKPFLPFTENYFYLGGGASIFTAVYLIAALTTISLLFLIILKPE
jgi:membrane-bound metal-dependent hydrolase YbcI (DUF457 family)